MEIRLLRPDDDRSGFDSGDLALDRFFRQFAGQNQFRHFVGATYVAIEEDRIAGFVTVSAGSIEPGDLPRETAKHLPGYPCPILRLGRMAVAKADQGRGIGSRLLAHMVHLALRLRDEVGCIGLVVDAKAGAEPFYSRYGFTAFPVEAGEPQARPAPTSMFLPIKLVADALG